VSDIEQPCLTIAICTRDQPASLRQSLASVAAAGGEVWETIVSDDGADPRTDEVVREFEGRISRLRLTRGPRLGVAANRNSCIDNATGDYLLFLNDNGRLRKDFISRAMSHAHEDTVVTGVACQGSLAIRPGGLHFLGFSRHQSGSRPQRICINATIFPTRFLRQTGFDGSSRCGHEEVEIALAAVNAGMTIRRVDATNCHSHSENTDGSLRHLVRSLAYLEARHYRDNQPNKLHLGKFVVAGLLNAAGFGLQAAGVRGGIDAGLSFTRGLSVAVRDRRRQPEPRPQIATPSVTVSVVVPTWRRPAELRACLAGILRLDPAADQVVVVRRRQDHAAAEVLSSLGAAVEECVVEEPGQVAALEAGTRHATGDVVAFTDDDAVPRVDWLRYLLSPYGEPQVAAVGGRDIVHNQHGIEQGAVERVGTVSAFGRAIGGHHLGVGVARSVDHIKGANMSFRRRLLRFPVGLRGEGAQMSNDLAACIALREQGWKVVYDPRAQVDHYPGERFDEDRRSDPTLRAFGNAAFNQSFVLFSLRPNRRLIRLAYMLLVGDRASPGLTRVLVATMQREHNVHAFLQTSLRAQWEAWRASSRAPLKMRSVSGNQAHSAMHRHLNTDGTLAQQGIS
jgi:glycosyltransferase involved in cell wall biosynthesis